MSMYPGHRGMGGMPPVNGAAARLNELLDQIRAEFEAHLRQTETYEHQSKPSASRVPDHFSSANSCLTVSSQVSEMTLIRDKVYQMEQAQMSLKQK